MGGGGRSQAWLIIANSRQSVCHLPKEVAGPHTPCSMGRQSAKSGWPVLFPKGDTSFFSPKLPPNPQESAPPLRKGVAYPHSLVPILVGPFPSLI